MFLNVAVGDVGMPPILSARDVDMLSWQQCQTEDTKRSNARERTP